MKDVCGADVSAASSSSSFSMSVLPSSSVLAVDLDDLVDDHGLLASEVGVTLRSPDAAAARSSVPMRSLSSQRYSEEGFATFVTTASSDSRLSVSCDSADAAA